MPRPSPRSIDHDQNPVQERSPKRRRVALACRSCRERKVRCDGVSPVCGACKRRGNTAAQCEYLVVAETAKFQTERAYVQSLHDHIAQLEGAMRQRSGLPEQAAASEPGMQTGKVAQSSPAIGIEELPVRPGRLYGLGHSSQETNESDESPHPGSLPNSIGAMGTAMPDISDADTHEEYYGQSSIVSLVQQCARVSAGQNSARRPSRSTVPVTPSTSSTTSFNMSGNGVGMSSFLSDDFSLPPRRTADWLLEIYFNNNHLFYPWVHKESFLKSYDILWSNKDTDSLHDLPDVGLGGRNFPVPVFYCALNAMFAIACEFSHMPARDKRTSSLMFYERMKSLINIDIVDSGSLAHVQALLLVANYMQCTPYPRRCWNIIGIAYRMSVGLGLYLSRRSTKLTGIEKEMRWRAWCACVQMDIISSMTMGRPAITSSPQVPLPSPIDDTILSTGEAGVAQPPGTVSANQFLYENMRLIGILGKILSTVYHNTEPGLEDDSQRPPDMDFNAIMDIDRSLEEFQETLHPALQWDVSVSTSSTDKWTLQLRRQSNVLHARYLHLKLLLYRPAFSEYCTNITTATSGGKRTRNGATGGSARSWSMLCGANCAAECLRSACSLVESLANATLQDATGAWWYGVFYLISAGIILISADFDGASFERIDKSQCESAWKRCLQTLHRMVDVHPSARDYAIALDALKQRHTSSIFQGADRHREQAENVSLEQNNGEGHDPGLTAQNPLHSPQVPPDGNEAETSCNILTPFLSNWESGLEDIMLPAHLLQDMDEGLLLPNLF